MSLSWWPHRGPFWLKGVILNPMALVLGGEFDLTASPSPSESPLVGIWTVIGVVLVSAILVGVVLGWKLHSWASRGKSSTRVHQHRPVPGGWGSLVTKALRFIHRRRTVALAFNNYSHHQLPSVQSPPRPHLRRRRGATPGPKASPKTSVTRPVPWSEGPVFHGPYRGGTQ